MDPERVFSHKMTNTLQSVLLLAGMTLLLTLVGWFMAAWTGVIVALVGVFFLAGSQQVSPHFMLRMYGARLLTPVNAPGLVRLVHALAQRAHLQVTPALYYIPSAMMNAFTVGQRDNVAIGVTDGLLRHLDQRELAGVLAHEISHVRNNDTWVMGLADVASRLTAMCASVGQIWLLITLPFMLLSQYTPPWLLLLVLLSAPTLSALLQLALSRTREFDADLDAARLTGDPMGLASALAKLERYQQGFLERIFLPGRHVPEPSLLRTHPTTEERIRRLRELEADLALAHRSPMTMPSAVYPFLTRRPQVVRVPRWRLGGLWF